ncbi:MAG: hypothetical protein H5T50_03835 [Nitrososphaeria archaeon]|nr:hypothetical protein [Nitrososphaeria archaeon]
MKKVTVFLIQDGVLKKIKVEDYGDFIAYKLYKKDNIPTYLAWAKGKPLLYQTSRFGKPQYTYIVCPEVAWTLTTSDIVQAIRTGKLSQHNVLEQNNQGSTNQNLSGKDDYKTDDGDTFNPSTLMNDKSVAKWFGNIVRNREDEALRNVVTSVKVSKWIYLLLLLFGIMLGFLLPAFFGAFSGSASQPPPTYTP